MLKCRYKYSRCLTKGLGGVLLLFFIVKGLGWIVRFFWWVSFFFFSKPYSLISVRSRMSPHSYFCICQFLPCKLFLTVLLMLSLMLHVTIWHAVHNQVIPSIYTFCTTDQANCLHHALNLTNLQSCIKDSLQTQGLSSQWNCLVIPSILAFYLHKRNF